MSEPMSPNHQTAAPTPYILPGILDGKRAQAIASKPEISKEDRRALVAQLGGSTALLNTLDLNAMFGDPTPVIALVSYGGEQTEDAHGYMVAHGPDTGTRVDPANYSRIGLPEPNVLLKQRANETPIKEAASTMVRKVLTPLPSSIMYEASSMGKLTKYALDMIALGTADDALFVQSIICKEPIDGSDIPEIMGRYNWLDMYDKMGQLLAIYGNDARLAKTIVAQKIVGFHGSNSASLMGVLRHGLLSGAELRRRGHVIGSGERSHRQRGGDPAIRFADWRAPDTIKLYSIGTGSPKEHLDVESLLADALEMRRIADDNRQYYGRDDTPLVYNPLEVANDLENLAMFIDNNPNSLETKLIKANFPVAYGLSANNYKTYGTVYELPKNYKDKKTIVERVNSDVIGEFAVMNSSVPVTDLPVIAVPSNQIVRVRKLVEEFAPNTLVVGLESLTERTYNK